MYFLAPDIGESHFLPNGGLVIVAVSIGLVELVVLNGILFELLNVGWVCDHDVVEQHFGETELKYSDLLLVPWPWTVYCGRFAPGRWICKCWAGFGCRCAVWSKQVTKYKISYDEFAGAGAFAEEGDEVIFLFHLLLSPQEVELGRLGGQRSRTFRGRLSAQVRLTTHLLNTFLRLRCASEHYQNAFYYYIKNFTLNYIYYQTDLGYLLFYAWFLLKFLI